MMVRAVHLPLVHKQGFLVLEHKVPEHHELGKQALARQLWLHDEEVRAPAAVNTSDL